MNHYSVNEIKLYNHQQINRRSFNNLKGKFIMVLKTFLKRIDLFSQSIQFNYKKKTHFHTLCGGSISLIIITFLFIYFLLILNNIYSKHFPDIISSVIPTNSPLNLTVLIDDEILNSKHFQNSDSSTNDSSRETYQYKISIGFYHFPSNKYIDIDPSFFSVHAEETMFNDSSFSSRRLFFDKCKSFLNNEINVFIAGNIKHTYCIKDKVIVGEEIPFLNRFVNISIRKCVNYTLKYDKIPNKTLTNYSEAKIKDDQAYYANIYNNSIYPYVSLISGKESSSVLKVTCKTNEEINTLIKNMKIHLLYSKTTNNFTNPLNPVSFLYEKKEYNLMSNLKTNIDLYLGKSTLIIYDSVFPRSLFDSKRIHNSLTLSSENVFYEEVDQSNQDLITIYLRSSFNINKHELKFKDIFDVIASVGGLSKVMIYIGSIIALYFSNIRFKENLINEFYSVIDPKNNKFIIRTFKEFMACKYEQYGYPKGKIDTNKYKDDNLENALNRFFSNEVVRKIYIFERTREMEYSIYKEKYLYEFEKMENLGKDEELLDHVGFIRYAIIYEVFKNDVYSRMNYTFYEIIALIFCKCCLTSSLAKKNELFVKACNRLAQDTDFISIVKSILQFETVKKVFLDEDQLNLFNSVSNMAITIEQVYKVENLKEDLYDTIKQRKEDNTKKNLTQEQITRNFRKIKRCQRKIKYLNFLEDDEENLEEEEEIKEETIKRLDESFKELLLNDRRNELETDINLLKKLKVKDKYSNEVSNNYLEEFIHALTFRRKESSEKNESPKKNRKSTLKNFEINADYFWNKFSGKKQNFL